MIRIVAMIALATVVGLAGIAVASEDVVVRASVSPEEAWLGQRVRLIVDVLGADGWAQISDLGEVEVPGAYILRTESQGTRLSETIGGTSYTGQRYEMALYGQRPGRVEIPAIPVTVTVKTWGAGGGEVRHELMTPATFLTCKVPPGAEGLDGLITTERLDATQTWSAEPDSVALGDAITRTMTLDADDVSGMAFPPMQHPELEGAGIYPGQPSVTDETERGSLRGQRTETVTYVFEKPGTVALPAIVLPWWDLDAATLRRIELPGLTLTVTGELAPEPDAEVATTPTTSPRERAVIYAVIVVILILVARLGRRLVHRISAWRQRRQESEAAYYARIGPALRTGDPAVILGAIMRWLDRLDLEARPARLDEFLQRHGDDQGRADARGLSRCLATGDRFGEARRLGKGLRHARKQYHRSRRRQRAASSVLPELN